MQYTRNVLILAPPLPFDLSRLTRKTVDFDAQDDSFMAKQLVAAGTQDIPVGTPIFVTVEDAESVAAFKDFAAEAEAPAPAEEAAPAPAVEEKVAAAPAPLSTPPAAAAVVETPPPVAAPVPAPVSAAVASSGELLGAVCVCV